MTMQKQNNNGFEIVESLQEIQTELQKLKDRFPSMCWLGSQRGRVYFFVDVGYKLTLVNGVLYVDGVPSHMIKVSNE